MKLAGLLLLLCLTTTLTLTLAAPAAAQSFVAKSIVFDGAPQIPTADLLKLSGLTPGARLTQPDIEAAMNKLADSGLFTGVDFKASGDVLRFTLEPKAGSQKLKVTYTNLVWYTPAELDAALRSRLPAYDGTVPPEGGLQAQVERTLEALLAERGVAGARVSSQAVQGGRIAYTVESPQVVVGEVRIQNVDFDSDPMLKTVHDSLVGAGYLEGISAKAVQGNVAYVLDELGYLDEQVGPVTHAAPRLEQGRALVDMIGTATPGARYTVGKVEFPPLLGKVQASDFASKHAIKTGGLPSPSLATNTEFGVAQAFRRQGYLDAQVTMTSTQKKDLHTIDYSYKVDPGGMYVMRSLVFAGDMSASQQSMLKQAWKLPQGFDYDQAAVDRSLGDPVVATVCNGKRATYKLITDKSVHQVDVNLSCPTRRDS